MGSAEREVRTVETFAMASKTRQRKVGKGSTETGKVDTATEEDDIQWELICPICTDEIRDAVVAGDTHTYCRGCIKQWFKSCSDRKMPLTSPSTRETIGGKLLESASPLDTHFQAAGANIASILKLRESFSQLDPLRDVLAASLEGWQPPQVVMIGDESSGKSTILERLAMMPIFPRGDDLTTRLPIHLRLRYAEVSLPPRLEVIESATGKTVRGPYVIPSVSGHVDVRQQMDAIIQEEKRGQRGVHPAP
ncbi:hypothetical protein T484DRAFT_1812772 [Baffinella frigidus]|nr:hypothetical protein T484DRAFT_1812772 [Cryptophyta sp. CCMP2293]